MANQLGTNFDYRGKEFLDDRQNLPKNKEDLKNWNIPVPESFEVCLDGIWYYYDPDLEPSEETGHWFTRFVDIIEDSNIPGGSKRGASIKAVNEIFRSLQNQNEQLSNQLKELEAAQFPITFGSLKIGSRFETAAEVTAWKRATEAGINSYIVSGEVPEEKYDIDGNGVANISDLNALETLSERLINACSYNTHGTGSTYFLEAGSIVVPQITWTASRKGKTVGVDECSVTSSIECKGEINEEKSEWNAWKTITANTKTTYTFTISISISDYLFATGKAYIKFDFQTYTGTAPSDSSLLDGDRIDYATLQSFGFTGRYQETGTLSTTLFNCTGGKYPYILIPASYYRSSYKTYVNSMLNSDFVTTPIQVQNSKGIYADYYMMRTSGIQTGSRIPIEIRTS